MNQQGSRDPTLSPSSSTGHIDRLCDEFEKACQAGKPPLIEDFLLQIPVADRDRLLGELLEIELDVRQRAGEFVQVEDYRTRFPENPNLIESVFRRVVKTRRLGDYQLLEELGRGGMGVVYKARQIYLDQTVAVKILPRRYLDDPQAVSRFRREMQSIGGLNHPNIVRAYNAGEASGVHFLVMEFVDGINLQQLVGMTMRPGGPLTPGAACEVIRQAALGLQHAHEHQLVHRDVKPANLMLCRDGDTPTVKLLDMGLARLHAERLGDSPARDGLTQPGVTMGTIDYMAPEQWENPAAADIRADIYSLGCTLFFLLTGKPPYGDPAFDTGRKRLMAHAVAPVPSLLGTCRGCPQDLEEIYETMLAKAADDRFAAPAEVADAIAEFADAEELGELIAAIPADATKIAAAEANAEAPGLETARRLVTGSGGSTAHRRVSNRRMARQRFRRNVQLAVVGSLLAVIACLVTWMLMRPAGNPTKKSTPSEELSPAERSEVAAELALLPGLNGPWWFEEAPWLTPFLRQAISEEVTSSADAMEVLGNRPHEYRDSNSANVYQWLWEVAARCRGNLSPCQSQLLDLLKSFADKDGGDPDLSAPAGRGRRSARSLETALEQFITGHGGGRLSAVDLHTVALLEHRIAAVENDRHRALEARRSYEKAMAAYSAEKKPQMRLRCLVDSAALCGKVLGDVTEAKLYLDEALSAKDLPLLFHVNTLVVRGSVAASTATSPGEYEDNRFLYAKKLLSSDDILRPDHPLAAFVAERHASSLMYQWKVEEAGKEYQAAYHVRFTDQEEKDPFAAIYVFQDRIGIATAMRFRGLLGTARRVYKEIIDQISEALIKARHQTREGGPPGAARALRQWLADAQQRLADCELYGGAASDGNVNLPLAAEYYTTARTAAENRADSLVAGYKLSMVLALSGKTKAGEDALNASDADKRPVPAPDAVKVSLVRELAKAVLAVSATGATGTNAIEGRSALRRFLDQFKLDPAYHDASRGEVVELRLFAAEELLNLDLDGDTAAADGDLKYLDSLLSLFNGRRAVRPYLRRYYELAVRACNKTDLVQIAHYLIESRMDERKGALDAHSTLVLFSFTPKGNFAVFLPQDGRPGKLIPLEFTREQIKNTKGKPPHLDDGLVGLIKTELKAGRRVEVYWDDTGSRPPEDASALADRDWPFDAQLPLVELRH